MHINDVVICLTDNKNKPLREFGAQRVDKGRKCEVYAPVDTEYKFLIKNNTDRRIKVNIDIDGSTVSGRGLILDAKSSDYIERFVDVDKKFKTSLVTGDGVADPTSPENGIIKVRVTKEILSLPKPTIVEEHHHHHWHDGWTRYPTYPYPIPTVWCSSNPNIGGVLRGCSSDQATYSATCANLSPEVNAKEYDTSITLATVEGAKSNQTFGSTVWIGDDMEFGEAVFTFYLKLANQVVDKEYEQYLKLKEKFENK